MILPHRAILSGREIEALSLDLEQAGWPVLEPAVVRVNGAYQLLAGERRWAAMLRGRRDLNVWVMRRWADFMAWMLLDEQRSGVHQGKPMTLVDAKVMLDKINDWLRPTTRDHADQMVAEYLGLDMYQIRQTRYLCNWLGPNNLPEVQALARHELGLVAARKVSPSAAYERVKRADSRLRAPSVPAARQRKMLDNSVEIITGLIDGLKALGDLAGQLEPGECADWARELSAGRLQLERTIKALKERGNTE
jgi:hypothetical protein